MNYDPLRHHRRSIRLSGYDYSQAGLYFVTACTHQRENLFGEIAAGQIILNPIGEMVLASWEDLPSRFPLLSLDAFVVMPNHIHGIFLLENALREEGEAPLIKPCVAPTIGKVMRAWKSVTAVSTNRLLNRPSQTVWQRNYYEHIIRNEQVLDKARRYILENPGRWERDADNPVNL